MRPGNCSAHTCRDLILTLTLPQSPTLILTPIASPNPNTNIAPDPNLNPNFHPTTYASYLHLWRSLRALFVALNDEDVKVRELMLLHSWFKIMIEVAPQPASYL